MDSEATAAKNAINRLLGTLAAALSEDLSLDDDLQCALIFEDDVEVVIASAGGGALVSVRSPVAAEIGSGAAGPLRRALALNYGRLPPGIAVALDERSGQLLLLAVAEVAPLSGDALAALVNALVGSVPEVRAELAGRTGGEPIPDEAAWPTTFTEIRG